MPWNEFTMIFVTAVGLSMDAFAVSVCKGLAMKKMSWKNAGIVGLWFGGFQSLMPIIGYFLGTRFRDKITAVDHWIAFALLGAIGINMLREAFSKEEECDSGELGVKTMFLMAAATSIDALAVGITFAFLDMNIWLAALLIGTITFLLSVLGVKLGNVFGVKYKARAELAGGAILVLLGLKILLEGLGIL